MVIGRGYFFCLPVHTVKNVTSACRLMVKGLIIIIITIIIRLLRGGLHHRKRFSGGPLVENIETNTGNFKNLLEQRLRMSNQKTQQELLFRQQKTFSVFTQPDINTRGVRRICSSVENSANPLGVYIRLCKYRERVCFCFYKLTLSRKNAKLFDMPLIKEKFLSVVKSCT